MPSYDGVIPAHEIFQDRAFARTLPPDHRDLRQVQVAALSDGTEGVLQAVHQRDEILHPPVAHGYGAARIRRVNHWAQQTFVIYNKKYSNWERDRNNLPNLNKLSFYPDITFILIIGDIQNHYYNHTALLDDIKLLLFFCLYKVYVMNIKIS